MQIINELLNQGLITELDIRDIQASIMSDPDVSLDSLLVAKGISEAQIKALRANIYQLKGISITNLDVDASIKSILPDDFISKYKCIPIKQEFGVLDIGIVDPEYNNAVDALQYFFAEHGISYRLNIISESEFNNISKTSLMGGIDNANNVAQISSIAAQQYSAGTVGIQNNPNPNINNLVQNASVNMSGQTGKAKTGGQSGDLVSDADTEDDILDITNINEKVSDIGSTPDATNQVNVILRSAINEQASDIHIEHVGSEMRVRYRVDGQLNTVVTMGVEMHSPIVARIKILAGMKLDEKRKPQDGRFSTKLENHKVDYRVSSMPGYYGEKIVMRILDSYRGVRPLEDIGFSAMQLSQIRKALERPYGMVLISGPTGSGKTTTLYSMLNEIDRETRNVVSLEDPVEYNVPSMNQSQIFPEIGYTFATGLRSILRQDPDVIMVGEIRDAETAQLAIQAALTGHLVFSTIHTNNSVGVITRLMDMGVDPYLIAPTLNLAIAQRLVRHIFPGSESPLPSDPGTKAIIEESFKTLPEEYMNKIDLNRPVYEAIPSVACPSGTRGRLPVLEILEIDADIQKAILDKGSEEEIWDIARSKGMLSMREDAILKSMEGKVPYVEIASL